MTQKELEKRDNEDLRAVFSMREGRRFFARLMQYCGLCRGSFDTNPNLMAFVEGERSVGLMVLSWVQNADENAVVKIIEADKERKVMEWEKAE